MKIQYLLLIIILAATVISCNNSTKQEEKNIAEPIQNIQQKPDSNTASEILNKAQVPVLCYHRISDGNKGAYTVSLATFESHIKVLSDSGYHSVLPAQIYDYLVFNKSLPEKPFMISFDDSRSEHFEIAAPTLEKYGFRGAFFIMTITYNKKNYMTTDQIGLLAKGGHSVGLHSWDHTMATKYLTADDWEKQLLQPKAKLEQITGLSAEYWAYPNGVYNRESAKQLSNYMKLSFILSTKRDSVYPLQSVRRMIVPECSPSGLLKSMHRTF